MNEGDSRLRLRELRLQHNETQEDIAKVVGKSARTVGHWESGRNEPELRDLLLLADHWGVSVDYILGRSPLKHMREKHRSEGRVEWEADPELAPSGASAREEGDDYVAAASKEKAVGNSIEEGLERLIARIVARELARRQKKDGETV